jgi:hypothetical protein
MNRQKLIDALNRAWPFSSKTWSETNRAAPRKPPESSGTGPCSDSDAAMSRTPVG